MIVAARELLGVGSIPMHRTSASHWFRRNGCTVERVKGSEGEREAIVIATLPATELQAYLALRTIRAMPGTFDEPAHAALLDAPLSMREAATRKAAIATFLLTDAAHPTWPDKVRRVQERFGATGNTRRTLMRILDTLEGVDPINFAPALLAGYRSQSVALDVDPAAWRFFLSTIERAAPTYPLKAAWRDVRDVTGERGWSWPS